MRTPSVPDARDLRARLAWEGIRIYQIAPDVGLHPVKLGRVLNGREPLGPDLAERIVHAIEKAAAGR